MDGHSDASSFTEKQTECDPFFPQNTKNHRSEEVDIIFLDIDGVLLPFGGNTCNKKDGDIRYADGCIFPDHTMDALTALLRQISALKDGNPKLVLSSTWRAQTTFIKDILSSFRCYSNANPSSNVIWEKHSQSFFDITDPSLHSTRHEEIYNWIKVHHEMNEDNTQHCDKQFTVRTWIALDDEELVDVPDAYPDTYKHAVKIESSVGITHNDVDLAFKLLKDQMEDGGLNQNHT